MIDTELRNKVVLVTGGNQGIGAAIAQAFAAQGSSVFIAYLRLSEGDTIAEPPTTGGKKLPRLEQYMTRLSQGPEDTVRAIREAGRSVASCEADLADPRNATELFDRAESALGPVDVLVNNAAYCVPDTFVPSSSSDRTDGGYPVLSPGLISAESHDRHFAVNSRGTALLMVEYVQRFLRRKATWGRIVNVSTDGASGFVGEVSYGASKHALESYSRAAASELARFGITVNVVSLGAIQTGWMSPTIEEQEATLVPMGRVGEPSDVADAIVFFASHQARWITGQLLYVGGGHMMPL